MNAVEIAIRNSLTPEPMLTVSEWADENRYLSKKSSSEPGRWRTERTPYLREVMDTLSITHPAKKIVFMKSSQIGGSECANNFIGYIIAHAPGPTMLVQPTVDLAKRYSRLRIEPLIEESPNVRDKVAKNRAKDSANTMLQKDFVNGTLVLTGANSAAGLRSMPARFAMLDEIDAYPRDVEEEGDPIDLVMARQRTFSRRKALLISTPTIEGLSKISEEFERSDKRFFYVPCPHCQGKQTLKFENLKWPAGEPWKAAYYCEHCGEEIQERYKTQMLMGGEWQATAESDVVGFFINSLYSPVGWFSWGDIAKDYEDAKKEFETDKKTEKMRTFVNTILGETYKESGEAPEWRRLFLRREDYAIGTVPIGGLFLTCAADVQKDRIEAEVTAWGENQESWSVDYVTIPGDTTLEKTWNTFAEYIERQFETDAGELMSIKLVGVDSGYNTQAVYNFCRKYSINRVIPLKGYDELSTIIGVPKAVDVKHGGKLIRRGVKVWPVGSSMIKSELYGRLKIEEPIPGEPIPKGFLHFPQYNEEYFRQLCAEKLIIKKDRRGFSRYEWVKERERNEALDLKVYNRALAAIIGIDRFRPKDWERYKTKLSLAKPIEVNENKSQAVKKEKRVIKRKRDSGYW